MTADPDTPTELAAGRSGVEPDESHPGDPALQAGEGAVQSGYTRNSAETQGTVPIPSGAPDTPTADAPADTDDECWRHDLKHGEYECTCADTDLRERIEWLIGNAPARLLADALLLVFAEHERAEVEAARRDALEAARIEAWEWAASFGTLPGRSWPETLRYHARQLMLNRFRDRAACGETRQP